MAQEIDEIYKGLKTIREYLIKEGKRRYKGDTCKKQLEKADILIRKLSEAVDKVTELIKKGSLSKEEVEKGQEVIHSINLLYSEIKNLCIPPSEGENNPSEMADFDLKTAANLLPIMNDDELVTLQLIDAIELYETMLKDDSKKHLINFVIKTRLSYRAKLRIDPSYTTIKDLVTDMKKHLLTRKSDTALQSRLQNVKQNNRSISDFGEEVERLFTDLTISQADGNTDHYKILKPLNEKNAIRRFSEGLRDRKISTIIAARNFASLKDAIRAAQDEEVTAPAPPVFHYHRGRSNGRGRGARVSRNYFSQGRNADKQGNYSQNFSTNRPNLSRGGRFYRGSRGASYVRGRQNHACRRSNQVNLAEHSNEQSRGDTSQVNDRELNQFFRA